MIRIQTETRRSQGMNQTSLQSLHGATLNEQRKLCNRTLGQAQALNTFLLIARLASHDRQSDYPIAPLS